MRSHLEIRLEVLAREIAARKAPKIDNAANELFALAARKHEQKAPSDWVGKNKFGAAQDSRETAEVGTTRPSPVATPPSAVFTVGAKVVFNEHQYDLLFKNKANGTDILVGKKAGIYAVHD